MKYIDKYFRAIIENITDALIGIDKNGNINMINERAEELLGLKFEDVIRKRIKDVIVNTKLMRVIETKKEEMNQRFSSNGRQFVVNRLPILHQDEIQGAIALFHDVTDYNKISKKLNEDEVYIDILNTILDTFNEWIVVVDRNGIITMMSKAYKEFVGDPNPEGKHVTEVIENTRMHIVVNTGIMEVGEIQEIKGSRMIAMRIPFKKDGKVIGAVGKTMFKDVSDLATLSKKISKLEKEIEYYKNELADKRVAKYTFENLVGDSPKMKEVKALAKKAAKTNSNVLILGESGTGKELFAHAIHNASSRNLGPFVKINCAAIPSELLESELFGYEEGAFTGAKKGGKKGKFELANCGTILLDEIGDMPLTMQAKLLRVIQEKEVERLGGNILKNIDVRIITSTNKDLEKLVKKNEFREDLFYRLNVMAIKLPPLRERREDIEALANELKMKIANKLGIYVEGISQEAIEYLKNYDWPGNIRELENVIERAINLLDADLIIKPKHLPERLTRKKTKTYLIGNRNLKSIIEEVEKEVIQECLIKTKGNKNKAAKMLGISRMGLYKKIERYKLDSL
ncbi:sigma 54-interacting transcriptional regulator [Paramaledivibacter caminithermalis]|uniref:PAS domain S-box-containing protein n=1 Tax=Paramaledivibacter caminithermalis (strain DSM 15212 / CIP 107654 / DViRD3) TaxID=1121301 RepID=A0A1M6KJD8_PARC5|nr:sigma 54-interacting transcriptional regulator [Paramaledivibacter caminithermalis]SHJ59072.1 PAS domain S-box-containing protein [Paramaledivibacter caminithermalis DSM 15212]